MPNTAQQTSMPKATAYSILFAISAGHFINDSIQSVVPAMFPIIKSSLDLSYAQLGWIAFVLNMTSSVMQPVFGAAADRKPQPYLLPIGMLLSMLGVIVFGLSPNFYFLLFAVLFIGLGSAVFHPEGSRVAFMAAGSKRGLAQSIYQMGGNGGQSLAPIFTAFIFVPLGQKGALLFAVITAGGAILLTKVSAWYKRMLAFQSARKNRQGAISQSKLSSSVKWAMVLLIFFVFARSWYAAAITNFYQFYLIQDYGLSVKQAQLYVFVYLAAGVAGTFFGGPLADRFGRKNLLVFSMLGAAPLAVILPYVPLAAVLPLFLLIGFILLSSFSVAVVYAQELLPNKIGMASGLIVGLAFGMGAIGAVVFGVLADSFSIKFVMILSSLLPILGISALWLPGDKKLQKMQGK
ncbi:MFS transporter [Pseudobacillus wudalianchiensis]|uniref:Fosmidomycin resistance protein n=1 Tax=Pseudobacillus wudalianchiensis TaxID=1743143 RepID=A0A1B9ADU1_9BACI|nr:MFS transporter [Bacillus wudalianchiensis]OCA82002.1 Fosmidomycin resistance protein [Bacillus wudalianchiensis]